MHYFAKTIICFTFLLKAYISGLATPFKHQHQDLNSVGNMRSVEEEVGSLFEAPLIAVKEALPKQVSINYTNDCFVFY
jgi:hypothetical protein